MLAAAPLLPILLAFAAGLIFLLARGSCGT